MFKKIFSWLFIFIILVSLYGCFGKVEIDELMIAGAIGIDKSENGYIVTMQIVNSPTLVEESGNRAPFITKSEEGETVYEAIRKLTLLYPNKIFTAHFHLLVFGEEYAKEGIEESIYYFLKDPLTRHKFSIAIVQGDTAKNLLKIQTPMRKNPGLEIIEILQSGQKSYGIGAPTTIETLVSSIDTKGVEAVIPGLVIYGKVEEGSENKNVETGDPKTYIEVAPYGVFKDDYLVGWFNEDESIGYSHLMGKIESTIQPTMFGEDEKVSFEIYHTHLENKLMIINDKPKIIIYYKVYGNIAYTESVKNKYSNEELKEIEENVAVDIQKKMLSSIIKAQHTFKSDIFGYGQLIYREEPRYYKKIKHHYDEIFQDMLIEVYVEANITRRAF